MVEHDFVVRMSPKRRYKIRVHIRSVKKKGKPRPVELGEFSQQLYGGELQ